MNINQIKQQVELKKAELDKYKPINAVIKASLLEWVNLELTYTSNAIEGNTLTRNETNLIVNEGLSIGGKKITEILEVKNHDNALKFVEDLAKNKETNEITQLDLLNIHEKLLQGIDNFNSGKYLSVSLRISGSTMIPPNFLKVPDLMEKLFLKISRFNNVTDSVLDLAIMVHFELVTIHPFTDGNGRAARLLFNLILLQAGYPLVFIPTEQRKDYLSFLEKAQTGGTLEDYQKLMYKNIENSLDLYINEVKNTQQNLKTEKILKIGELAKLSGEDVSTIRYWTQLGILKVFNTTKANYSLYKHQEVNTIKQIRVLQSEKRLSLDEIKKLIG